MTKLTLAMGKRRRLWPPDESSCIACVGLLGWMQLTYTPPESAVSEMVGLLWLSGLRALDEREQRVKTSLLAGDQLAIDNYAAGVASRLLGGDGPVPPVESLVCDGSEWGRSEYDELRAQGALHGSALRQVLAGFCAKFEAQANDHEPSDLEFLAVATLTKTPARVPVTGDSSAPVEVRRAELFDWVMNQQVDWPFRVAGDV